MGNKTYISFRLWGEAAMWKHPSEAMGHFSGAGPSPSSLGGIIGACFGHKIEPTEDKPRPISQNLIDWLKTAEIKVTARTIKRILRISTNINAFKEVDGFETFRLQRKSIDMPEYEIIVETNKECSKELLKRLQSPHYPIYLGDSSHLGKILDVKEIEEPKKSNWAYKVPEIEMEEYVWNTKFGTNGSRLVRDGYWTYPAPTSKELLPTFESCVE
jgi:hypothetical protein